MHKGLLRDYLQPKHGWRPGLMQRIDWQTDGRLRVIINAKRLPWPQNYKIFSNVYASGKVIFPKNTGWLQRAYYDGRYFNITIKGFRLSSCPYQPDSGLGGFDTILLAAWDRAFGRDDDGSRPF